MRSARHRLQNCQCLAQLISTQNAQIAIPFIDKNDTLVILVHHAAHLIKRGDGVIIATFTTMKRRRAKRYTPAVVFADARNRPTDRPAAAPKAETVAANGDGGSKRRRGKKSADPVGS